MARPKSFRKVPDRIRKTLAGIASPTVVVGCIVSVSPDELLGERFNHLGVSLDEAGLHLPRAPVVPPAERGKFSTRNVEGYEVVRRDLPLETAYNFVETPNWGDSYNGTHTVALPFKRYPRDRFAERNTAIRFECPDTAPGRASYSIRFELSEVLKRSAVDFEARFLECVNLLQENVGDASVAKSDATFADYVATLRVAWEILPPGTADEAVERVFSGRTPSREEREAVVERFKFFQTLRPQKLVFGGSGFDRYFGAMIRENLLVFENVRYGNAIYVMFENWQELSQRSRVELLSGRFGDRFERVIHTGDWMAKVKDLIRRHR